jgi:hypothetical protein
VAARALSVGWIPALAEPYLRGYAPRLEPSGALHGCWFGSATSGRRKPSSSQPAAVGRLGFFVGFLSRPERFRFLKLEPPACLVFAFVRPPGSPLHRRLVAEPESLVRWTFEYIRWLTHRPPRFEFYERELPSLVRHCSMREWPRGREEHYARNYFIETLALLVRSGLVRRLKEAESAAPGSKTAKR